MEKIITISNRDYRMKASALTQFSYKNETGRSFMQDLQSLVKLDKEDVSAIDNVIEIILKISYIMVKEYDKTQVINYEEFLSGIDNLYDDIKWIQEVLELACSPLSRRLQNNQN